MYWCFVKSRTESRDLKQKRGLSRASKASFSSLLSFSLSSFFFLVFSLATNNTESPNYNGCQMHLNLTEKVHASFYTIGGRALYAVRASLSNRPGCAGNFNIALTKYSSCRESYFLVRCMRTSTVVESSQLCQRQDTHRPALSKHISTAAANIQFFQ